MLISILSLIVLIFLAACDRESSVCPDGSISYAAAAADPAAAETPAGPAQVEIGGKTTTVDQVITGSLCNQTLRGTVYVSCALQLLPWEGQPDFLDGCDFNVEPGTVIYVAAHNDAAYYKGCASCHASGGQ